MSVHTSGTPMGSGVPVTSDEPTAVSFPRYGNELRSLGNGTSFHRHLLINIRGFPRPGTGKMEEFREMIRRIEPTTISLPENNRNWSRFPYLKRPHDLLKKELGNDAYTTIAYN